MLIVNAFFGIRERVESREAYPNSMGCGRKIYRNRQKK
jgi:hypothetical protein